MSKDHPRGNYYPDDPYSSSYQVPRQQSAYQAPHPPTSSYTHSSSSWAHYQQTGYAAPPPTTSGSYYDSRQASASYDSPHRQVSNVAETGSLRAPGNFHQNDPQATFIQTNNELRQLDRLVDRPTDHGQRVGFGSRRRELGADYEPSKKYLGNRYSDFERARYQNDPGAQYRSKELASYYAQNSDRLTTHPGQDAPAPKPDAEERRLAKRKREADAEADAEAEKIAKLERYAARAAQSQNPYQGSYVPAPPGYYYQTPAQGSLHTNKRERTPEYDENGNELSVQPRKKRHRQSDRKR